LPLGVSEIRIVLDNFIILPETPLLSMKKLRKEDIKQEVFDLYDDYAHNRLDRRTFMEK
jgi:hypothetical protein